MLEAAAELAAAVDRRLSGARAVLEPPTEGANNAVARLTARGGVFFGKVRANRFDDAPGERWALRRLGGAVGPKLVFATSVTEVMQHLAARKDLRRLRRADSQGGAVLLLEGLPGRSRARLDEQSLAHTARAVAKLHRTRGSGPPLIGGATAYGMLLYLRTCLDAVARASLIDARTARSLGKVMGDLDRHLQSRWWGIDGVTRSLCHGDLRPANLLFTSNEAHLIDFEHAGMADPMADLARFVAFADLSPSHELCLLDAYAEATRVTHLDRYFAYRPLGRPFAALAGARFLLHVLDAEQRVLDDGWVARRKGLVEAALSTLLGDRVRLNVKRKQARPARVVVAIDGLAGSGKTPLARALAQRLGVPHLNTGAAYRAAALLALEQGWSASRPADAAKLARLIPKKRVQLTSDGRARVDGQALSASLEVLPVEQTVAQWAAQPRVRRAVDAVLSRAVRVDAAVIEGRDVQTRLRPDATLCLFVGRDEALRKLAANGRGGSQRAQLLKAFEQRDRLDLTRAVAPAKAARGAMVLKSALPLEDTVRRVLRRLEARRVPRSSR